VPKKPLTEYAKKRSFEKTPEPKPKKPMHRGDTIFVVHKHDASHLHYDVRLEVAGVLASWAVPKGPPKTIGEKHLAVQTEDHPYEYATFEGEIPEGNYGAGTVEIWDSGTYENIKKDGEGNPIPMRTCIKKGSVEIYFHGKRLKGPYALVRTHFRDDKTQWLMIKMRKRKIA
jgi:bifunctional non-homologous end joining protein LigD